jgi:hypothetical protein
MRQSSLNPQATPAGNMAAGLWSVGLVEYTPNPLCPVDGHGDKTGRNQNSAIWLPALASEAEKGALPVVWRLS